MASFVAGWVVAFLLLGSWALPGALWLAGPAPGPVCKLERQLVRTAEYSLKTVMVPVCSSQ